MHTILLVDDEKCILDSLYRGLKKEPYDILCAESGKEALDILEAQDVSLILSDVKMPGMDGIEFLRRASKKSPHSVKILLSGYSEVDLIVDAINTANLWRYVPKPWNNEDLIMAIKNGIEYFELKEERRELTAKLEKKNLELEELNCSLEEKVKERTELINCHVNLLLKLIDGIDYDDFTELIIAEIKKIMDTDYVRLLQLADNGQISTCGNIDCESRIECERMIEDALRNRQLCCGDEICVMPVVNGQECFAVFVIKAVKQRSDHRREALESLLVIFRVAIQREIMKAKTSSIMGDIEKLLEGC